MAKKNHTKNKLKIAHKDQKDTIFEFLNNNLLFLSMYVFAFLVLITIFIDLEKNGHKRETIIAVTPQIQEVLAAETSTFVSIPRLNPRYNLSVPVLSAQGAIAIDFDSEAELFEKDPDLELFPASTVKIMTALVALDYYKSDEVITVGNVSVEGQKMGLFTGEKLRAGDLIRSLLVYSANDAAEVLADSYPGGREVFVEKMNLKSKGLGLTKTLFINPTGLDGPGQITTVNDLITISKYAMTNEKFAQIVSQKFIEVKSVDGLTTHSLENTNKLLGTVEGVKGIKTGWTEFARENLVTYVEREGRKVLLVLLGSQDRFGETEELIEWIFENYEWIEVRK